MAEVAPARHTCRQQSGELKTMFPKLGTIPSEQDCEAVLKFIPVLERLAPSDVLRYEGGGRKEVRALEPIKIHEWQSVAGRNPITRQTIRALSGGHPVGRGG